MKLHCAPGTISVAVAITLEEAGLAWSPARVDFASGEQRGPTYARINPKGRVPALETDAGTLTETGALLEYIAALAPDKHLVPADPLQAFHMREVMYYLATTMHVNHAHGTRGHRWADQQSSWDDMTAKVPQTMTASAEHVETCCLRGPLVLGKPISLADPYLFVICSWLEKDGVDVAAFPKIVAFQKAMEARTSVQAIRAQGLL